MTDRPHSATGRTPVLVAASGADWEAQALNALARAGPSIVLTRRCVDLTDLLATATTGLASVAVVSSGLPGLDADSVERLRRTGVAVLVVAHAEDLLDGDANRLRRMGVRHVLAVSELDGLASAVALAAADTPADARPDVHEPDGDIQPVSGRRSPRGRTIAVWGPAGAPGRTTVAVGLSSEIALAGHEALLLDVDPYGGAVAQHLGVLDEASGLLGAARAANAGQLDAVRLEATARQVAERFRVLTGLPRADRWPEVRPAAFSDLLAEAAGIAEYVVLDTGFSLESDPLDPFGGGTPQRNLLTLTSLERADEVLVVGSADPVGLSRLARGLVELREVLPGAQPRVVVNRVRASLGWSNREIRGMVEGFVSPVGVHFLPDDRVAVDRALMAGRSLAETGDSPLRTALVELARVTLGEPVVESGRRFRRRLS